MLSVIFLSLLGAGGTAALMLNGSGSRDPNDKTPNDDKTVITLDPATLAFAQSYYNGIIWVIKTSYEKHNPEGYWKGNGNLNWMINTAFKDDHKVVNGVTFPVYYQNATPQEIFNTIIARAELWAQRDLEAHGTWSPPLTQQMKTIINTIAFQDTGITKDVIAMITAGQRAIVSWSDIVWFVDAVGDIFKGTMPNAPKQDMTQLQLDSFKIVIDKLVRYVVNSVTYP